MSSEDLVAWILPYVGPKSSPNVNNFSFFVSCIGVQGFFFQKHKQSHHTPSAMKSREYITSDIESSDDEGGIKNLYVF